jgi:hypothetical protein
MGLTIRLKKDCKWDLVSLGEVMLRLDPGDQRIATTRRFDVCEGGGEYNVARGLKRCFGLDTAIVTAFADDPVGRLLQDFIYQGGVDQTLVRWVEHAGVGRLARNGLNFTERGSKRPGNLRSSGRGRFLCLWIDLRLPLRQGSAVGGGLRRRARCPGHDYARRHEHGDVTGSDPCDGGTGCAHCAMTSYYMRTGSLIQAETCPSPDDAGGRRRGCLALRTPGLLVDAAGQKTAVHHQQMPSDEARGLRGEEYRGTSKLIELPESLHRSSEQEFPPALGSVK